jgi:hypothetical protein
VAYKGSCHCGDVSFEVEGEICQVLECNCSHCRRKGYLLWFVPRAQLRHDTPEHHFGTYTFNKHLIQHHFCLRCGAAPFAEAKDAKGNPAAVINLRCLEEVELEDFKTTPYDGRSK